MKPTNSQEIWGMHYDSVGGVLAMPTSDREHPHIAADLPEGGHSGTRLSAIGAHISPTHRLLLMLLERAGDTTYTGMGLGEGGAPGDRQTSM